MKWLSFIFSSYRVQNANIILNILYIHSSALPPFTILGLMTRSQQRPSWLSWQSVALDSRGRVSSILTDGLAVAFFATASSLLSLGKLTHSQNIHIIYLILVIECKMPILFLIYTVYTVYNIYCMYTRTHELLCLI